MSTELGRPLRARRGSRLTEALAAIRQFEADQVDWGYRKLALTIGCDPGQARALVATLVLKGRLEYRETTVRKMLPVLTDAATGVESQAA